MAYRFVSLNAWGGREWDSLRAWVPDIDADILCLQEVIRAPDPSPEWLTYNDPNRILPQRADLFVDVSALLPGHIGYFAPAARGTLTDNTGQEHASEHGIAVWVRRSLALSHLRQDFVWGSYRSGGWGEEPVPRAIQIGRISGLPGGSFCFAHFHGLRDPSGKGDIPSRRVQTDNVLRLLGGFAVLKEPLILAGDFNVLPDNPMFTDLATLGIRDQITANGISDTRTTLYSKPQRFADYLLTNQTIDIHRFEVPAQPELSDHRPLILDFDLQV
ncbi:MAG: endonuclease/exonuclease/phosphatase family protein [Paracoccaceae bacterium]